MAWMLKYCEHCKAVFINGENECKKCGATLITSEHSTDTYDLLDATKKAEAITRCFGEEYSQWDYDKEPETEPKTEPEMTNNESGINIGLCLKAISIISIILSGIGASSIGEKYDTTIGITAFFVSLVFFLFMYGIGEICSLLASINRKLK